MKIASIVLSSRILPSLQPRGAAFFDKGPKLIRTLRLSSRLAFWTTVPHDWKEAAGSESHTRLDGSVSKPNWFQVPVVVFQVLGKIKVTKNRGCRACIGLVYYGKLQRPAFLLCRQAEGDCRLAPIGVFIERNLECG